MMFLMSKNEQTTAVFVENWYFLVQNFNVSNVKTRKLDKARKGVNQWTFRCSKSNRKLDRQKFEQRTRVSFQSGCHQRKRWNIPLTVVSHFYDDFMVEHDAADCPFNSPFAMVGF